MVLNIYKIIKMKIGRKRKKVLMFWSLFKELRACSISVAASGSLFYVGKLFLAQKLSREARGAQNSWILEKQNEWMIGNVFWCF